MYISLIQPRHYQPLLLFTSRNHRSKVYEDGTSNGHNRAWNYSLLYHQHCDCRRENSSACPRQRSNPHSIQNSKVQGSICTRCLRKVTEREVAGTSLYSNIESTIVSPASSPGCDGILESNVSCTDRPVFPSLDNLHTCYHISILSLCAWMAYGFKLSLRGHGFSILISLELSFRAFVRFELYG